MKKDFLKIFTGSNLIDKPEKKMQSLVNEFIEYNTGLSIIEEMQSDIPELSGHGVLILKDLERGLKVANRQKIDKYLKKYPSLNEKIILDSIIKDFIYRFDNTKSNIEKHHLVFTAKKEIHLKHGNENIYLDYVVIDTENYSKNIYQIVKEKRIEVNSNKKYEYPDFAVYFNGIPFLAIEIKTIKAGLQEAFKDARTKPSYYKNFFFVVGTTCLEAFIMSDRSHNSLYLFEDYDDNGIKSGNGFVDLLNELIFQKENLLFYAQYATLEYIKEEEMVNARVQQYYVLKKVRQELELIKDNKKKLEGYFKHHTRTGKTITFKLIMNYIMVVYVDRFNTIYFFTHDLTVLNTIVSEMANFQFGNKGSIQIIESKQDYLKKVKNKQQGLFVVNMQKISDHKNILNDSYKLLILIDEIHTFQDGDLAKLRSTHFPNASYIGATATPIYSEYTKKQLIELFEIEFNRTPTNEELEEFRTTHKKNVTEEKYGKELDNFTPSMAKKLKLITELSVSSILWEVDSKINFEYLETISNEVIMKELNSAKFTLIREVEDEYNPLSQEDIEVLNSLKEREIKDIEKDISNNKLLKRLQTKINRKKQELKKKIQENQNRDFFEKIFDKKINYVTNKMKILTESSTKYKPSFFWVVSDVEEAIMLLRLIKEHGTDSKQNIYNGFRFAVDVSQEENFSISEKDKEYFENLYPNQEYNLAVLNGDVKFGSMIKDFESEEDGTIDCLILVGKRLMGYDNKNLTAVFLDRTIGDLKLMMQFITRPTTIRDGKSTGYVFDLTISRNGEELTDNLKSIQSSFVMYDKEDKPAVFFSKSFLDRIFKSLEINLEKMRGFFANYGTVAKDFHNNKNLYSQALVSIYNQEKTKEKTLLSPYFNLLKEINNDLKELINPVYQFKSNKKEKMYEEILALLDITKYLNHIILNDSFINEKNYTYYTDFDIQMLSREIFEIFGKNINEEVKNINDIIQVDIKGDNQKEIEAEKSNRLYTSIKNTLINIQYSSALKDVSVFKRFKEIQQNTSVEEIEKEYKDLEKALEKELKKVHQDIKENFENNIDWFIVFKNFDFSKEVAKHYTELIVDEINTIYKEDSSALSEKEFRIIIENLSDEMRDLNFLKNIDGEDIKQTYSLLTNLFSSDNSEVLFKTLKSTIDEIIYKKEIYKLGD